jgi:hypothetical protein
MLPCVMATSWQKAGNTKTLASKKEINFIIIGQLVVNKDSLQLYVAGYDLIAA